ncbi:unnamed protein product, partial [Meganyctiphanes norvegica]
SESSVIKQLLEEAEVTQINTIVPPEDVIERLHTTDIALIVPDREAVMNKYADFGTGGGIISKFGICKSKYMEEPLKRTLVGFGMPRNSPLAELINERLLSLVAAGVMGDDDKNQPLIPSADITCLPPPKTRPEPVVFRLAQLASVFIIWAIGILLACFTFIVELIYHRYYGATT